MNIIDIINKKRLGYSLTKEEINYFIANMLNGNIKDYQVSSLLMAITIKGMTADEAIYLTDAMINSGDKIDLSFIDGTTVDKHSTGGVGDKVTLVLAPLLASLGFYVAKMSGRGLGHTGGTIDKLEAIEGYQVELNDVEFKKQVQDINIALVSQTSNLAPADKKLYALRDVTGTVESIPLIASSIMSKKIASGSKYIIIDVKVGNGALMKNIDDAKYLANLMIEIGKIYNRVVICVLTNMNEPLGLAIGNGLEVIEAIDSLKGQGPVDLNNLVLTMASITLQKFKNIPSDEALNEAKMNLLNGLALTKFEDLIERQKGNINNISISSNKIQIISSKSGYIKSIDTYKLGEFSKLLGSGRETKDDVIDYGVGLVLNKKIGDYINQDELLITIYYNNLKNIDYVKNNIESLFEIQSEFVEKPKLILDVIC